MSDVNSRLSAAVEIHRSGDFRRALDAYGALVAESPNNAHLLNLMGAACIELQQFDQAKQHLTAAISANAGFSPAHDNLGALLSRQGHWHDSISHFERAIAADPRNQSPLFNLAVARVHMGQIPAAIEVFQKVLRIDPNSERAHAALADLLKREDRAAEALLHVRQLARARPDDPTASFELGMAQVRVGLMSEAEASFRETLRVNPAHVQANSELARLLVDRKQYDEAVTLCQRALQAGPGYAEAHVNLGNAFFAQKRLAEARLAFEQAIRLKPTLVAAHNNMGALWSSLGDFEAGEACVRTALTLDANNADVLQNMGMMLVKQARIPETLDYCDRALAISPLDSQAHHCRASALLLTGDFPNGLLEYEWRFKAPEFEGYRHRWPVWRGGTLEGKTVVLCHEQGLGDTLQFVRYAQLFKERGAQVIVECPRTLHLLLARTPGIDRCIAPTGDPPRADFCVPMLSLPLVSGTTLDTIPSQVPYLNPNPALVAKWGQRLAGLDGLRVGIAWQGNKKYVYDHVRSVRLAEFTPLLQKSGVRLINLQAGPGREQLSEFPHAASIIDLGGDIDEDGAFTDTAAIMRHLDLVVTIDTAIAHLAGGLGVETWVALGYSPDWRWMLDRTDCPWYPTMRLFRQTKWHDWAGVFGRIATELEQRVAKSPV